MGQNGLNSGISCGFWSCLENFVRYHRVLPIVGTLFFDPYPFRKGIDHDGSLEGPIDSYGFV